MSHLARIATRPYSLRTSNTLQQGGVHPVLADVQLRGVGREDLQAARRGVKLQRRLAARVGLEQTGARGRRAGARGGEPLREGKVHAVHHFEERLES